MPKILLIVDPQNDFIPGGSLPVPLADETMDNLAIYMDSTSGVYDAKVVSVDAHPYRHCSFSEYGGHWPRHCVEHTSGAAIRNSLVRPLGTTGGETVFLTKGTSTSKEEYSLFKNWESSSKFQEIVERYGTNEVDVCGIVREICVMETIKDLHADYPNMRVNILMRFTPSLDSGVKFQKFLEENKDWLNPIV